MAPSNHHLYYSAFKEALRKLPPEMTVGSFASLEAAERTEREANRAFEAAKENRRRICAEIIQAHADALPAVLRPCHARTLAEGHLTVACEDWDCGR